MLDEYGVELLGASVESVQLAEDRELFKEKMKEIGQRTPRSFLVKTPEEGIAALEDLGFPIILRASFTLGGSGSGIAHDREEFRAAARRGAAPLPGHAAYSSRRASSAGRSTSSR